MRSLTAKIARFIDEYSIDGNGAAAAVRAGYAAGSAHVTASRLIRNAKVQAGLAHRQQALAERFDLDRQRLVDKLLKVADLAKVQDDPAGMVAAYREIGRMCGFYALEKRAVASSKADQAGLQAFEAMSDEELVAIVAGGDKTAPISTAPRPTICASAATLSRYRNP